MCGETIRPGNERNTSPSVAIDVFDAEEIHDVTQVHIAWGYIPVYGHNMSLDSSLGGLLTED